MLLRCQWLLCVLSYARIPKNQNDTAQNRTGTFLLYWYVVTSTDYLTHIFIFVLGFSYFYPSDKFTYYAENSAEMLKWWILEVEIYILHMWNEVFTVGWWWQHEYTYEWVRMYQQKYNGIYSRKSSITKITSLTQFKHIDKISKWFYFAAAWVRLFCFAFLLRC